MLVAIALHGGLVSGGETPQPGSGAACGVAVGMNVSGVEVANGTLPRSTIGGSVSPEPPTMPDALAPSSPNSSAPSASSPTTKTMIFLFMTSTFATVCQSTRFPARGA